MRYPENLPEGGTLGLLAPSLGCNTEPCKSLLDSAVSKWKSEGYRILLGPNCYAGEGVGISNTPQKCAEEVMEMFTSDADALISCSGGELMCEILPYVDFNALSKAEPKWYMGYSDNTNLIYLLATLADTASVYGPCAPDFGMKGPMHPALTDAFGVLTGECRTVRGYGMWEKENLKDADNPYAPYNLTEPLQIRSFFGKKEVTGEELDFSGRLIGGCMDCLVPLVGTCFDRTKDFIERYREDGFVWFLEACDLNVFFIRRAMWQMEEAGWFQNVKGFLIGRPLKGEPRMNLDAYDAVLEVAGRKNVPVIMDVDIGHTPPMMPLIVGSIAKVRTKGNDIEIRFANV